MLEARPKSAISNPQSDISDTLNIRPLTERRRKLKHMYDMLHHMRQHTGAEGVIIGEGFYIAHIKDEQGNDLFNVFRRGFGKMEQVEHIGRVAGLFTPEMFCDGINVSVDCPALPESSRCSAL